MHQHHHHHSKGEQTIKSLWIAFALNLSFTLIEVAGGWWTNSMAILSDAVHDFGDTLAILSAILLERYSKKAANQRYPYGYGRYSLLAALLTSFVLLLGSVGILYEAIPRLMQPESVNSQGMFLLAILGLIVNGAAVFQLRGGSSINQRAIMLHLLEDVLGWAAVLIGAAVIYFTEIWWIDPLLSIGISIYILWNAFKNAREVLLIFLQRAPTELQQELRAHLIGIEGIADIHQFRLWSIDGEDYAMTLILITQNPKDLDAQETILKAARQECEAHGGTEIDIGFLPPQSAVDPSK